MEADKSGKRCQASVLLSYIADLGGKFTFPSESSLCASGSVFQSLLWTWF